jgi:hypothetical protein
MQCKDDGLPDNQPLQHPVGPRDIAPQIKAIGSNHAGQGWLVAAEILYRIMNRTSAYRSQGGCRNDAHLDKRS